MIRHRALMAGALLLTVAPASHAMQLEVSRPELCGFADKVVVAEVVHVETHWSAGIEGGLERHVMLRVDETLAGNAVPGMIVVLPGGRMRDFWHHVEDVPDLELGARYALFVEENERGWMVIGGDQGAVRVATPDGWPGETLEHVTASLEDCRG